MKDHYIVSVNRVPGVTRERMQEYIQEAVQTWAGSFRPSRLSRLCGFSADETFEIDPLGPPCPLMAKGAVSVKMIPRGAKLFSANRRTPCY